MLYRIIFGFITFFLAPIASSAQQVCEDGFFQINGFVTNEIKDKSIYISYLNDNDIMVVDSAIVINNRFIFKGNIENPVLVTICNNSQFNMDMESSAQIYLEAKNMDITTDFFDFKNLVVQGSRTQEEYVQLTEIKKHTLDKRDSISKLYTLYFDKLKNTKDTIVKSDLKRKIYNLDKLSEQNNDQEIILEFDFIRQNPSSFISPYLLYSRLRGRGGIAYYGTIDSLYNEINEKVQNSVSGKRLLNELSYYKNSRIGSISPHFEVKDVNNTLISLGSFRNEKYVLLDFWASWCAPCIDDFPFLKKVYENYQGKGFEIISISKDSNSESWRKAITKHNIKMWKHFSITDNIHNQKGKAEHSIEKEYFVTAIPVKVLINKEGIIIGRWRGGGEENRDELEKALKVIFNN